MLDNWLHSIYLAPITVCSLSMQKMHLTWLSIRSWLEPDVGLAAHSASPYFDEDTMQLPAADATEAGLTPLQGLRLF